MAEARDVTQKGSGSAQSNNLTPRYIPRRHRRFAGTQNARVVATHGEGKGHANSAAKITAAKHCQETALHARSLAGCRAERQNPASCAHQRTYKSIENIKHAGIGCATLSS